MNFNPQYDSPQGQVKALKLAKEKIKFVKGLENVEVANPHLGFLGSNKMFLVTDYYNGYSIDQIRGDSQLRKYLPASKEFTKIFPQLEKVFSKTRLTDFDAKNVIFVPSTGKFILIDLRLV